MKLKEGIVKKIIDNGYKDEEEDISSQCEDLSFSHEKLNQLIDNINEKYIEIILDLIDEEGGSTYDFANDKAYKVFCTENNIDGSEGLENEDTEKWEEYWNVNKFDYLRQAYDEVGIDDNVDDECRRDAISSIALDEDIHEAIMNYLYWNKDDPDIWEESDGDAQ